MASGYPIGKRGLGTGPGPSTGCSLPARSGRRSLTDPCWISWIRGGCGSPFRTGIVSFLFLLSSCWFYPFFVALKLLKIRKYNFFSCQVLSQMLKFKFVLNTKIEPNKSKVESEIVFP
jgi:hypothetical protein